MDTQQELVDLLRNVSPISLQQFVPAFRYSDQTPAEGVLHGLGLSVMPDESPAYAKAVELASARGPDEEMDSSKLAHYRMIEDVEQGLRSGVLKRGATAQLVRDGELTPHEAASIDEAVRETRHIKNDMTAKLYLKVKRLPMAQALQVWDLADRSEREAIQRPMKEKKRRYQVAVQQGPTALTTRERAADPTWNRLRTETFRMPE